MLNVSPFDVPDRTAALLAEVEDLRKQLSQLAQSGDLSADALLQKAETIGTTRVVVAEIPGANPNLLRQLIDQLRKKADSTAILFAAATGEDKVLLVAGLSRDLVQRGLSAGNWSATSPRWSAVAAAAKPTWPKPAASIRKNCPKPWKRPARRSAKCSAERQPHEKLTEPQQRLLARSCV